MHTNEFTYPCSAAVLNCLTQGSLRQDLAKALRLWVILHSIYGDPAEKNALDLPDEFSYADWRDRFFITQTVGPSNLENTVKGHNRRDDIPDLHDPACNCAKSLTHWLFNSAYSLSEKRWREDFLAICPMNPDELERLLETGVTGTAQKTSRPRKQTKRSGRRALADGRLFAITGKELQNYFKELVVYGWLAEASLANRQKYYQKVSTLPSLLPQQPSDELLPADNMQNLLRSEIADWLQDFHQPINGVFRSKAHLEYIIPTRLSDQVRHLATQLKHCWSQTPVPPIQLEYYSARLHMDREIEPLSLVVYPVRLDYLQRATYLYAYGQQPACNPTSEQLGWYDYRMDRIVKIKPLTWADGVVPVSLKECFHRDRLPSVHELDTAQEEVWGYEVHQPPSNLVVRFDPYFYAQYVQNTERTTLLNPVKLKKVQAIINSESALKDKQRQHLLEITNKNKNGIYCHVQHRLEDQNITKRLRAWGPKVEIMLPWKLRQIMANDAKILAKQYTTES